MDQLLDRLRSVNSLLQKEGGFVQRNQNQLEELPFQELVQRLAEILGANTYVINQSGVLLGYDEEIDINNERVKQMLSDRRFPTDYTQNINQLSRTEANIGIESQITAFPIETRTIFEQGLTSIIPIFAAGTRLGSLIIARLDTPFDAGDLILAEQSAMVIAMELLHLKTVQAEELNRVQRAVRVALDSLTYSERHAIVALLEQVKGQEAQVTASKIAQEKGITRSVIVNAIRKLESARILSSRSLGMKGTYIKFSSELIAETVKRTIKNTAD